jgi:hypothetical protein
MLTVEEQGMSIAHDRSAEDWLDACCWRCGTAEPVEDSLGRLLCRPCLVELSDAASTPEDPLRVVRGAYWDAHALERCWRCLTESVDPNDDIGLCGACLSALANDATTQAFAGR